jgi:hypothetical protein
MPRTTVPSQDPKRQKKTSQIIPKWNDGRRFFHSQKGKVLNDNIFAYLLLQ